MPIPTHDPEPINPTPAAGDWIRLAEEHVGRAERYAREGRSAREVELQRSLAGRALGFARPLIEALNGRIEGRSAAPVPVPADYDPLHPTPIDGAHAATDVDADDDADALTTGDPADDEAALAAAIDATFGDDLAAIDAGE